MLQMLNEGRSSSSGLRRLKPGFSRDSARNNLLSTPLRPSPILSKAFQFFLNLLSIFGGMSMVWIFHSDQRAEDIWSHFKKQHLERAHGQQNFKLPSGNLLQNPTRFINAKATFQKRWDSFHRVFQQFRWKGAHDIPVEHVYSRIYTNKRGMPVPVHIHQCVARSRHVSRPSLAVSVCPKVAGKLASITKRKQVWQDCRKRALLEMNQGDASATERKKLQGLRGVRIGEGSHPGPDSLNVWSQNIHAWHAHGPNMVKEAQKANRILLSKECFWYKTKWFQARLQADVGLRHFFLLHLLSRQVPVGILPLACILLASQHPDIKVSHLSCGKWWSETIQTKLSCIQSSVIQLPEALANERLQRSDENGIFACQVGATCTDKKIQWFPRESRESDEAYLRRLSAIAPKRNQVIKPRKGGTSDLGQATTPEEINQRPQTCSHWCATRCVTMLKNFILSFNKFYWCTRLW